MRGTAREQILAALDEILLDPSETFTIPDVLDALDRIGTDLTETTIRTHITSRMCANAPDNHAKTYADLERVGRGIYRLRKRG